MRPTRPRTVAKKEKRVEYLRGRGCFLHRSDRLLRTPPPLSGRERSAGSVMGLSTLGPLPLNSSRGTGKTAMGLMRLWRSFIFSRCVWPAGKRARECADSIAYSVFYYYGESALCVRSGKRFSPDIRHARGHESTIYNVYLSSPIMTKGEPKFEVAVFD